jgi:hypothetical protein
VAGSGSGWVAVAVAGGGSVAILTVCGSVAVWQCVAVGVWQWALYMNQCEWTFRSNVTDTWPHNH